MKKSKQVLLSAAIAAAIMGSVSLPQVQAATIGDGVKVSASQFPEFGKYDVKTTNPNLNTTLATQEGLKNVNSELAGKANAAAIANQVITKEVVADNVNATNVNASNLNVGGKASFNDNVSIDQDLTVDGNVQANAIKANTITADEANVVKSNISNLSVSGKAEFNGTDGVSISDDLKVGGHVEANTINATGAISSNQINGTTVNADNLDANTTKTGKLTVGNIDNVEQAITDNKAAADKAQKTADGAQKDATKANDKADAALKVTGNGVLYNHATNLTDGVNLNTLAAEKNAKDIENETNNRVVADNALSDRITNNSNAITNETNDRVAADTVLSNRITENSSAIQSLRHDVSDLGTEIDNVGAISAALAGLHPLDWNGSGSKFQLSAAAGTYDGKQAMALGGFYHPNRNMMLSLGVSSSLGSDRKTAGNVGITFRVGKGSNGTVSDDVAERLAAMDQKISQLESQNQKLTSMLAIVDPSLTKEFPDVPANHWAYEAVSKLAGNGIVEGYPDGDFHGDRTITRYEMAQVIYKALKKGGTVDQKLVKEFNKEIEAVKANDAQ